MIRFARAMLSVLVVAVLLIGVGGGCYWLSLIASLNGLEAGIRERDVVKLEKYIDWPRVREQIRSDLRASVMTQVFKKATTDKDGGLASSIGALLAGVVAPSMIDGIVDGFVTPQSLVRLLEEKPSSQRPELKLAREGFTDLDEYTLLLEASGPIRPGIRAILRRDGITWRVVRIVFPPGEAPWETLEPRLQLGKIVPTRSAGSLVIEGDVTNSGNVARDVPPLRVALRDSAEKEVQFRIIDPPKARLSPSETARFKTTFDHPDAAATGVVVTFSPEAGVTLPNPNPPPSNAKPDTSAAAAPMVKQESEPSPMPPQRQEVVQPTQAYIPPIPAQPLAPQAPPASTAPPQTATATRPKPVLRPNAKPEPTRQTAEGEAGPPSKKLAVQPSAPDDVGNQQARNAEARPYSQPRAPLGSQTTASEADLVRQQIVRCWNVPPGARDAGDLVVEIRIEIGRAHV